MHSHLHSDIWKHYMEFCRVYRFSCNQCELWLCQTENFHLSSYNQSICIHMPRFSWSGLTWWLRKIVPHTCRMIFHILLSVALFSLSFSRDILYLKIIKSCSDHCIPFMLCFNFLLFFSLICLSTRITKSCHRVEFSFINSSWINTGINTGNHQNHELVSWETFSSNSCT